MEVWPGRALLLATCDGAGTNFSLVAPRSPRPWSFASSITAKAERISLEELDAFCWYAYLPHVGPG